MVPASDDISRRIARRAATPQYFKIFIENFNDSFNTQTKVRRPITRFSVRRSDQIEDFASGLARYIYSRVDLAPLLIALAKSKAGEEDRVIAKFLNVETKFHRLFQEYLDRRKVEKRFSSSVAAAVSDQFFGPFANALADTLETISTEENKSKERLREQIERSALNAPRFENDGKRIRATHGMAEEDFSERKAVLRDRCNKLKKRCSSLGNQQRELTSLVQEYDSALRALRPNRGLYGLVLAALDIQTHLEIKAQLPPNEDDNVPLDQETLGATTALLMAHTGMINVYPDVDVILGQIDRFRAQSKSIDALRDRVLDPVLQQLAASKGILDKPTQEFTQNLDSIDRKEAAALKSPSQAVTSVKFAWLRGALTAMGRHVLSQGEKIGQIARDTAVKEAFSSLAKNPTALTTSIMAFIAMAQPALLRMSEAFQASFGWLRPFLTFIGLTQ